MTPFPGTLSKKPVPAGIKHSTQVMKYFLTPEQEEWLRRWFPEIENSRLMKASGIKFNTLHRFARELGLTKSEKGFKAIKRRQAKRIIRTCQENGFYESIKGRKMSEACLQGTAMMWEEIREGKRLHPIRVVKQKNPRKYKRLMKEKSERRKEAMRREKARLVFGLERKTKLLVRMSPYTRRQVNHRHNALKRGYFVSTDTSEGGGFRYLIFFDDKTQRSALFERNLMRDGFRLRRWVEAR